MFALSSPSCQNSQRRARAWFTPCLKAGACAAAISVKGKHMGETDRTFAASLGNYTVKVNGGSGNLNCPSKAVTLSAGSTIELSCTSGGWAGKK
jgi:hypothetical protein